MRKRAKNTVDFGDIIKASRRSDDLRIELAELSSIDRGSHNVHSCARIMADIQGGSRREYGFSPSLVASLAANSDIKPTVIFEAMRASTIDWSFDDWRIICAAAVGADPEFADRAIETISSYSARPPLARRSSRDDALIAIGVAVGRNGLSISRTVPSIYEQFSAPGLIVYLLDMFELCPSVFVQKHYQESHGFTLESGNHVDGARQNERILWWLRDTAKLTAAECPYFSSVSASIDAKKRRVFLIRSDKIGVGESRYATVTASDMEEAFSLGKSIFPSTDQADGDGLLVDELGVFSVLDSGHNLLDPTLICASDGLMNRRNVRDGTSALELTGGLFMIRRRDSFPELVRNIAESPLYSDLYWIRSWWDDVKSWWRARTGPKHSPE
ncbi:MAG: hypothetical protein KF901_02615 [Myxococcales bacterium]|nr:hypothetical protein [Myxococcales bacterium]